MRSKGLWYSPKSPNVGLGFPAGSWVPSFLWSWLWEGRQTLWGNSGGENTLLFFFMLLSSVRTRCVHLRSSLQRHVASLRWLGSAQASVSLCFVFLFFFPPQISLLNSVHENFSQ